MLKTAVTQTTFQMFGVSIFIYFIKLILLFSKDALNWLKVTVKTFYNVTKDFNFQ